MERQPLASRTRKAHRAQATAFLAWLEDRSARSFDPPDDPPACARSGRRARWLDQGGIGAADVGGASASR